MQMLSNVWNEIHYRFDVGLTMKSDGNQNYASSCLCSTNFITGHSLLL